MITSGNVDQSTRVFGHGAPNVATLQIFDAGPNGQCGGGDDTLIGTGSTDANGNFNDGQPGIAVTPLVVHHFICAVDVNHNVSGPPVQVQPQIPVPTLGSWGAGLLGVSLGLALALRTWMTSGARRRA